MDDSDALFAAAGLERVEPVDAGIEAGAGVNKRFRSFALDAVMLPPLSLDERLPQDHLARFIADLVGTELVLSRFHASHARGEGSTAA